MTTLRIVHMTRYLYDRPVCFGVHHLMLRPRDAHDMRILRTGLAVSPTARLDWTFDTFGNSVGWLSFEEDAAELVIVSELDLRRYGLDDPLPVLSNSSAAYPFQYDPDDATDLGPLLLLLWPGERSDVEAWIASRLPRLPTISVEVLDALSSEIHDGFRYRRREAYGTQSPATTIRSGEGTCRDFALLFMEAARTLGFAARFVTGYLYDPASDVSAGDVDAGTIRGGGSTHAWADVFIPGVGWVEFDPTNRIAASRNLVRVATTRSPSQAAPVSGTWRAAGARFLEMDVSVSVVRRDD
ncbi:transglutaminase [Acuticoccus sediminis]|uniref:Transglutaminase n=1 Tax=Acuticoccus sediminis TaxID=2184697 RepID=A0A8B2NH06_9HYPH|nr:MULTISPECIES: transglutaminase family protein [Acuticoccus]MCF3934359.1 transglutaminase family protein [Acuticoccus kalidii]RAH95930.1 transglutaminase [Acuticoccus sediminis]